MYQSARGQVVYSDAEDNRTVRNSLYIVIKLSNEWLNKFKHKSELFNENPFP